MNSDTYAGIFVGSGLVALTGIPIDVAIFCGAAVTFLLCMITEVGNS